MPLMTVRATPAIAPGSRSRRTPNGVLTSTWGRWTSWRPKADDPNFDGLGAGQQLSPGTVTIVPAAPGGLPTFPPVPLASLTQSEELVMSDLPKMVQINEEGPREGIQF
jgi:hypothetical protein